MAYKDTPIAADSKQKSQPEINENFLQIATFTAQDHETFNSPNLGKHKLITLTRQAGDSDPPPTETAIYSKLSAITGESGLFWQKEETPLAVAGEVIELTEFNVAGNDGYTVLPSGLKINFGRGVIIAGIQGVAVVFNDAFTANCFACTVTPLTTNGGLGDDYILIARNLTQNGFTASRADAAHIGTATTFSYIAIGD